MRPWTAPLALILVLSLTSLPAVVAAPAAPPKPAFASELWGGIAPSGWGFTPGTIANPGPTIQVLPGEPVDLTLNSVDIDHQFHVDYDGDNFSDPGEPQSAQFPPSVGGLLFSFFAPGSQGAWWYRCPLHGFGSMRGRLVVTGNAQPQVSVTNPRDSGETWTGGSTHTVTWTMSDPDHLPNQLTVWVNYSSGAGSGTIAGPALGITSTPWTLPAVDVSNMAVTVDVVDPVGARVSDTKSVPNVDSTAPTVTATVPTTGAMGVDPATSIQVTFSEAMDQAATQGAVSLCQQPGCVPVTLNVVVWSGPTVTLQPAGPLARDADHQATVSTAARDASDPGNAMAAPHVWTFRTASTLPSASVTSPTAGLRWTGGSTHSVTWTASDAEDPAGMLTVWVNYSANGNPPWTPVAGPVPGTTTTRSWTVPTDNTTVARIEVTVNDTSGATGTGQSGAFSVDSTAPGVSVTNPTEGQTDVPVGSNLVVGFTEPMNTAVTGTAAVTSLEDVAGGTWVPLAPSWDGPGQQLTVNPGGLLAPVTSYRLHVNGSALDASDPGNALGATFTLNFTTSATPDLTPPTIQNVVASPASQTTGGDVTLSADVADDIGVESVSSNVTIPGGGTSNLTMTLGTGTTYSVSQAWTVPGAHTFVVWASDTSENWASASGSFTITAVDTTPPTVNHTSPGTVEVGEAIVIRALVTDESTVQSVRIVYTPIGGSEQNITMAASGSNYTFTIPGQAAVGIVTYRFYAVDAAGNDVLTQEYTVTVVAIPPPSNVLLYLGIVILIFLIVMAIAYVITRRKRRGGGAGRSPPT